MHWERSAKFRIKDIILYILLKFGNLNALKFLKKCAAMLGQKNLLYTVYL